MLESPSSIQGRGLNELWDKCVVLLQDELPAQQFNTWIRPLKLGEVERNEEASEEINKETSRLHILAPNRFVKDWVAGKYQNHLEGMLCQHNQGRPVEIVMGVCLPAAQVPPLTSNKTAFSVPAPVFSSSNNAGHANHYARATSTTLLTASQAQASRSTQARAPLEIEGAIKHQSFINKNLNFDSFIEGKSNQLARAAAQQVAENPGSAYNPLFICGGVGLGKTHLMHAVGNAILADKPDAKVVFLSSERFVADMVKALQLNAINEFKRYYRSVDALLIDDIQFLAGKERSQEEFFQTFNALLEGGQQIILTCDRYPKEIKGLEERLRSRFGWGLTVPVEPPELETRVAILIKKAEEAGVHLPSDAAFFIAQRFRSHVRDLEGALKRVMAQARFTGSTISVEFVKEALKDLLALQDRQVSIMNIQQTVAEYYKVKSNDLLSKRRNRSIARPRQVAMTLAKELTNHSLPEIGDAFGGRDHTTVLHACRKISELKQSSTDISEDYKNLLRALTT